MTGLNSSDQNSTLVEEVKDDVLDKIVFEGKKYFKSNNDGAIYHYYKMLHWGPVVIGKWNDKTNKIEFISDKEEPIIVVKKIVYDGKQYLKSKKTGIIYDRYKMTDNCDPIEIGRWNDKTNKIDFHN